MAVEAGCGRLVLLRRVLTLATGDPEVYYREPGDF